MAAEASADLARAQTHLRTIGASPRAAGSDADRAAQAYVAEVLTAAGYDVRQEPFEYSAFPGGYATPLIGAGGVFAIASAGHLAARDHAVAALLILVLAALVAALAGRWLAREGVLDLPVMRATATNVVATRPGHEPRVWLVAHTDSKSQPIPQAVRAAGIVALAVVWLAATVLAVAQTVGAVDPGMPGWIATAVMGVAAGAPVVLSVVGNRSDGALDNASGVAAVMMAAEGLPRDLPVGVLITSAEEYGLAGAGAWARRHGGAAGRFALNCDGVDDTGVLTTMYTGSRRARVVDAIDASARMEGIPHRARRLVPGILVDAVALEASGIEAATLSRGTVRTLARVHSPADSLSRLRGDGIPEAARVLCLAAERLAGR